MPTNILSYPTEINALLTIGGTDNVAVTSTGNVGIGTTSPTQKLDVVGNIAAQYDANNYSRLGSSSSGGYIQSYSGGTEKIMLRSYGDSFFNGGNVGIGTSSPAAKLDIAGGGAANTEKVIVSGDDAIIRLGGVDTNGPHGLQFGYDSAIGSDGMSMYYRTGPEHIVFENSTGTSGSGLMVIQRSGNVGIGTTSPALKLHISQGGSSMTQAGIANTGTGGARLYFDASNGDFAGNDYMSIGQENDLSGVIDMASGGGSFHIQTGGSNRFTVTQGGNVGIGTTSPSSILHIGGGTVPASVLDGVLLTLGGGQYYQASDGTKNIFMGVDASSYGIVGMLTDHDLGFRTNNTVRMLIDTSGNVGIGTTSPSHMLDITTDKTGNGAGSTIRINRPDNSSYENAINWATGGTNKWFLGSDNDSTENFYLYNWAGNGFALTVKSSNNYVGIGTTSPAVRLDVNGYAKFAKQYREGGSSALGATVDDWYTIADFSLNTATNTYENIKGSVNWGYGGSTSWYAVEFDIYFRGAGTLVADGAYVRWSYRQTGNAEGKGGSAIRIVRSGDVTYEVQISPITNYGIVNWEVVSPKYSSAITLTTYDTVQTASTALSSSNIVQDSNFYVNGNVGIGTTSPGAKLDVVGSIGVTSGNTFGFDSYHGSIYMATGGRGLLGKFGGSGWARNLIKSDGSATVHIGDNTSLISRILLDAGSSSVAGYISLQTKQAERVRIDADGNVGIGTTSPKTQLHLNDGGTYNNTDANNRLFIERNDHAYILMSTPDDKDQGIHFHNTTDNALVGRIAYQHRSTGDSLRFRVGSSNNTNEFLILNSDGTIQIKGYGAGYLKTDASGNISVDTSTIEDTLQSVTDRGNSTTNNLRISNSSPDLFFETGATHYNWMLAAQENIDAGFEISVGSQDADSSDDTWSPKLVVKQSGNVGIGTTSPGAKLDVSGNIRTSTYYNFNGNPSIPTTAGAAIFDQSGVGPTINGLNVTFRTGNTPAERMRITSGGNVGIGTTSPSAKLNVAGNAIIGDGVSRATNGLTVGYSKSTAYTANSDSGDANRAVTIINNQDNTANTYATLGFRVSPNTNTSMGDFKFVRTAANENSLIWSARHGTSWYDRFTIKSDGNVGIGTTSPDAHLEISANAGADPSPITNPVTLRLTDAGSAATGAGDTTNPWAKIEFYSEDQSSGGPAVQAQIATIYDDVYSAGSHISFSNTSTPTNGLSEKMRITSGGNVGIGTTSPSEKLHVDGNSLFDGNVLVGDAYTQPSGSTWTTSNSQLILGGSHNADFNSGTKAKLVISGYDNDGSTIYPIVVEDENGLDDFWIKNRASASSLPTMYFAGNVGIGTTSPAYKLDVNGDIGIGSSSKLVFDDNNSVGQSYVKSGGDLNLIIDSNNNQNVAALIVEKDTQTAGSGTELFRVQENGNVGIGTTAPANKFHVADTGTGVTVRIQNSTAGSASILRFQALSSTSTQEYADIRFDPQAGAGALIFRNPFNSERMRIADNGNVGIGYTSPSYKLDVNGTIRGTNVSPSDARLKENVETIPNALERVNAIRGVAYNKIGEQKRSIGVVAQELLEALPEVVYEDDKGMYSVDYGSITGILIEAIKEQQKQIDELKAIIANK